MTSQQKLSPFCKLLKSHLSPNTKNTKAPQPRPRACPHPVAVASTPPNASTAEMAAALEALLGGFLRPQAVVAISLETELGRLIPLYRAAGLRAQRFGFGGG